MAYTRTIRLTSPTVEPVTLEEAKAQLLVDHSVDDELIRSLISVARDKAEQYCNRYFADATASILFDRLPSGNSPLFVPVPNVVSVDSVSYIDSTNASAAITGTTFDAEFQHLWPADSWPDDTKGARIAVSLTAPVGIEPVKQAILLFVTDYYEYRANLSTVQIYDNMAAISLLQPYRVQIGI